MNAAEAKAKILDEVAQVAAALESKPETPAVWESTVEGLADLMVRLEGRVEGRDIVFLIFVAARAYRQSRSDLFLRDERGGVA